MSYAFVNQVQDSKNGTGFTTIDAPNFTPPAGALLILGIWIDGNFGAFSPTVDDIGGRSFAQVLPTLATSTGTWKWFYLENAANVSSTPHVVLGASFDFPAVYVAWYSGIKTSGAFGAATDAAQQRQLSPGTGTDAVTSGVTSTLSGQPALQFGFVYQTSGVSTPVAGTGFTSRTSVWDFAGSQAVSARPEDKRLTATTAVEGTGTSLDAAPNYMTMTATFLEDTSAANNSVFYIRA